MQYFKTASDEIFAYENDVTLETINELQSGLTSITEAQALAILNPTPTLSDYKDDLDLVRLGKERLGITVTGHSSGNIAMQTDASSRALMSNYIVISMADTLLTVDWRAPDGSVTQYNMADFKKLSGAVTSYVNLCMQRQNALIGALDAASDPSTVDLNSGWPSTTIAVTF